MEAENAGDVRIDWWCQRLGCWLLKVYGSFGGEAHRAEIVGERYSGGFLFRSLIAAGMLSTGVFAFVVGRRGEWTVG
jgi:hypothetical protein